MGLFDLFLKWHRKEYSLAHRAAASVIGLVLFMFLIPWGLIALAGALERSLGVARFVVQPLNMVFGALAVLAGLAFAGWTVAVQLTTGRGTPVPAVPPKRLIVSGPYRYCRNPMVMGYILYCFGLSIWLGSAVLFAFACGLWGIGAAYIKLIEEKELEARFGDAYREYRDSMPMFIPRLGKKR
ncbi:MAG TPA: isoprenylcysteine carboxylmethyltransferase family protein [Proteobacteria bacterium]|nr:isoprenylcysteine carboxylmethyltransferase family protein [Pseudomonadota bacterium]